MIDSEATRLAGEAYRTRLAHGETSIADDKTRLAQEGYQSKLARDAAVEQPDTSEFYKIGERIGDRYEVLAIHHGAMGVVYGCFDHETKLPRALKTIRSRHSHDKQVLSLFESEAAVWISLEKHPYIVRAYSVERFNKLPYVITEYVCGPDEMERDLRGWLGHPRLTLSVAVTMALQIAQGMQHAVRKVPNFVHRDIKPANILVNGDGKAMVTDFGLVQAAQSDAGTPAYMSPEQWRGETLDPRSDIYAYGCILFEMFTAHRLFPALTERDWEGAHQERMPAALTSLTPEFPAEIDHFVRRCLEKNKVVRPKTWDEVVTFFALWYHRLTGKAVVSDFSSIAFDADELVTASFSLFRLKRYEESELVCNRALSIETNDPAAWFLKGHLLFFGRNQVEDAILAYDKSIAIEHDDVRIWFFKGEALNELKRYDEAFQAFDQALAIDPLFTSAWRGKGHTLSKLKRHDEALQAFDQALAIDPGDTIAWGSKGHTFYILRRYEEALHAYDQALAIDEENDFYWERKGKLLRELKRHEEAIQPYDRALVINPNNKMHWRNKGNALNYLRRHDEAIKAYEQLLIIDQNDFEVWSLKGDLLSRLGRFEEAINAYDQALEVGPEDEGSLYCDSLYSKGVVLHELKRYEEAIRAYDEVIDIFPDEQILEARQSAIDALKESR